MKIKISMKAPGASLGNKDIDEDESTKEPSEFETKQHLDDILRAHEIINNPVKMKAVHKLAGRHQKAISNIQDIKDHYQNAYGPKGPGVTGLKDQPSDDSDDDETY